jgi:dipeptidyl aminopeptidase/acylaminoacyl peptidase
MLALALQSCLGLGDNNDNGQFKSTSTGNNGNQIGINTTDQAVFKGKIYFTLDRNLYVVDGTRKLTQLTHGMDVRDPAVSPDGKSIAFIIRYKDYSDLAYMPSSGGKPTILLSGNGRYVPNPGFPPKSTHHWYAEPSWSADSTHLLFLSDLEKFYPRPIGVDAFLLDLMVFSTSIHNPNAFQEVAYATYGDGGLRDPSYRPKHNDQIVYTNYKYDTDTQTHQVIQLYMEDPNAIANHPYKYRPGADGLEVDPAVPITPAINDVANMEPAFSPDGNTIVYIRREDATHNSLYTMPVAENITTDPNNTTVMQKALQPYNHSSKILTQQYVSKPTWSPDGKEIAYLGYANTTFDIWLTTLKQDPKTGTYTMKDSPVQLTNANGHLDADSGLFWTL